MKILVTGRDGQVARSLAERSANRTNLELFFAARPRLDLSVPGSFATTIEQLRPDVVINAAAFTAVDRAESEEAVAHRINAVAAGEGADAAAALDVPFIQLSTDYVFDGTRSKGWREEDPVMPVNAYGRTKAAGEQLVLNASPQHAVIRTSWLVGPFGHNFIKTMMRLAQDHAEISVVDDQYGSLTSTLDLADALLSLAPDVMKGNINDIWHVAGNSAACWADIAEAAFACSAELGGPFARVRRISTSNFPRPAKRPANSILNCLKAKDAFGLQLPGWREVVHATVHRLIIR